MLDIRFSLLTGVVFLFHALSTDFLSATRAHYAGKPVVVT